MRVEKKQWRAVHLTQQESISHTVYPHKHLPECEDSNMPYDRVNVQEKVVFWGVLYFLQGFSFFVYYFFWSCKSLNLKYDVGENSK